MRNFTRKRHIEMRKQQTHKTQNPFTRLHISIQKRRAKMRVLLLQVMLAACAASPQDLSGKMFTFPQETNTAHVKLTPSREDFSTVTVCHRSFTDLKRDHILFSMATPSNANSLLVFWDEANKEMESHIKDKKSEYRGLDYKPNTWHSICTTWDSTSGLVQLWFNGKYLIKKYSIAGSNIRGTTVIILGQEQDSHGGGFDMKQSFVGMMSDVHMWDYILSPCEIRNYMDDLNFTPGNVLNWRALEFQIRDRVLIEDKITSCQAN
ncbi:serum amyloid P-component-like [Takifugu rubripes]|uniref:Serum amyloid P-component-like n=1 Tax=Takifugu rubripes TaxID=31033 RepID=A0A674NKW0_TAKRU|nr:serum amyloid P-component-like [Takifugu rubripes]